MGDLPRQLPNSSSAAAAHDAPTVAEVMTRNPITVRPTQTVRELARLLFAHQVSGMPVVDKQQRLIGVVSKTDLLRWCVKSGFGFGSDNVLSRMVHGLGSCPETIDLAVVRDLMTADVVVADPHECVATVAHRMALKRVHRLIVVDAAQCVVGIVTTLDLLRVFPRSHRRASKPSSSRSASSRLNRFA